MTNEAAVSPALPKINDYGLVKVYPQAILDRKIMRKGDRASCYHGISSMVKSS
jgi:hypothetical protein